MPRCWTEGPSVNHDAPVAWITMSDYPARTAVTAAQECGFLLAVRWTGHRHRS